MLIIGVGVLLHGYRKLTAYSTALLAKLYYVISVSYGYELLFLHYINTGFYYTNTRSKLTVLCTISVSQIQNRLVSLVYQKNVNSCADGWVDRKLKP